MIIKLDTSIFRLEQINSHEIVKQQAQPLTRAQRVTVDRIVIAVLYVFAIVGALLF